MGAEYPRACRLLRRAEFEAVYQGGHRRASKHFVIFYLPQTALPASWGPVAEEIRRRGVTRFGVSLKRSLGGAVVRNRIRRRIREITRLHRQEFSSGWDIVIHPRSTVATAPFGLLEEELRQLILSAVGASANPPCRR